MKQAKEFFLRRIAVALVILMVIVMLPIGIPATATETAPQEETSELAAVAPKEETVQPQGITADGLKYEVYSDHIEITHYTGNAAEVVIPSEIEGLPVTSIGYYAFYGCTDLTSVTIPDSVTSIGDWAFSGCTGLTSMKIGSGVTGIGDWAFSGCTGLTSISVASGNTVYHSAGNCLIETESKTLIQGCNTSVIPSDGSVTSIGYSAFSGCTGLTSVTIPDSVTSIGGYAFSGCTGLTSVTIGSGVTSIAYYAFYGCTGLTSVKIGSGVTSIGDNAFRGCTGLTSVTIPDSVTSIGDWAFNGCTGLTSISVASGNTVYHSAGNCLIETASKTLIQGCNTSVIPSDGSVTSIGYYAFNGCTGLTSVTIPDSVTSIDESAFNGCTGLTSVTIPDSVTEINGYYTGAFENCSSLTSIQISNSVTRIGNRAFSGCSSLTSIVLPESLSSISWEMFNGCSSLSEITIPESVTKIVYRSFVGCDSLSDVYYGGSKSGWDAISIGHSNEDLTNATIHYAKVDAHNTIDELTDEDYWVLSHIAYWNFDKHLGKTMKESLTDMGKWDKTFEDTDMKYSELCGAIGHWKVVDVGNYSNSNGFYGVTFANGDDAVIAYRGSIPLNSLDAILSMDAFYDWVLNDLYPILLNRVFSQGQYNNAITMYENAEKVSSNIAVTGHSLGGGLADIISARYGCKGVSMNAISILDAFYVEEARALGSSFAGVDKWEFIDHANQHDVLAGSFEMLLAPLGVSKVKPVIVHQNISPYEPSTVLNAVNYHGLGSFIERNAHGTPSLTDRVSAFIPDDTVTSFMGNLLTSVDLGTSNNNNINHGLSVAVARVSYGGDGQDTISTNIWGDTLIGGRGYDELDGSWGNDIYYYYKGDGVDTIHDVDGSDRLFLLGFDEDDTFSVLEDYGDDYIHIRSGGETIVKISKKNREYVLNAQDRFKIIVGSEDSDKETEVYDITDAFYKYTYGEHLYIGCPVHVEVLCPKGNVVFTLTDGEVGTWYTDYGNFYVFEEENGEYGKVLDLVEGYTARIVGADEGTMDVTYQVPVDGELTDPVSVSGVPVTENLTATIEETEDGDVYLVIDEDSDGETDSERKLYGECPFTDVPEGSFYYEPVMWAVEEGITNGATETTYNPNGTCLRAQVVTFLHRADGNPDPTSTRNPFTDVKSGDFFYKPVLWAVEKGITNGTSATTFGSYANCNRAAVVTFLWRAAGSPEPESTANPFVDVKATDFFYKPVLWAVENGITNGVDATHFGPTADCNRAQVVTFLYRAFN